MTFSAVVVTHANPGGLARIIENLASQTRSPDRVVVCHSGYDGLHPSRIAASRTDAPLRVIRRENLEDWGHDKRAAGLQAAIGDWVGFFNDDDRYEPVYLERMLAVADEETDVVYCAWNEQPNCDFALTRSTAGNFIVRSELAKRVGYPTDRIYENDGHFIERLNSAGARVRRVDDILYHHNG